MDRINQILYHPFFIQCMKANEACERERIFCRHDMAHVTDVARIAYILYLELPAAWKAAGFFASTQADVKERIYAAALLHDIGRHVQYETGEEHALVSARLAHGILYDCGFEAEETAQITEAIAAHSDKSTAEEVSLRGILAKADRLSRACYMCKAQKACKWSEDRKNRYIVV